MALSSSFWGNNAAQVTPSATPTSTPMAQPSTSGSIGSWLYNSLIKPVASTIVGLPGDLTHSLGAAGISLGSMAKGEKGTALAKSKQAALDELRKAQVFSKPGVVQPTVAQQQAEPLGTTLEKGTGALGQAGLNLATVIPGLNGLGMADRGLGLLNTIGRGAKLGAKFGATSGVTSGMEQGQGAGQLIDSGLTGGLAGGLIGGVAGGVGKGLSALASKGATKVATGPSRVSYMGQNMAAGEQGLGIGQSLNGKQITPARQDELLNFAKSEGLPMWRGPATIARDIAPKLNDTGKAIDKAVKSYGEVSKPTMDSLKESVRAYFSDRSIPLNNTQEEYLTNVLNNMESKTTNKSGVGDAYDIWNFRKGIDDSVPNKAFAPDATLSKEAEVNLGVRTVLNDFLRNQISTAAPLFDKYHNLSDISKGALNAASKTGSSGGVARTNVGGISAPVPEAKGLASAIEIGTGNILQKFGGQTTETIPGETSALVSAGTSMLPGLAGLSAGSATPGVVHPQATPATTPSSASPDLGLSSLSGTGTTGTGTTGTSTADKEAEDLKQRYSTAMLMDLVNNKGKNVTALSAIYNMMKSEASTANKSVAAVQNQANVLMGLSAIKDMRAMLAADPSLLARTASGTGLWGISGNLAGTTNFLNARDEAMDVISRIRTGKAMTSAERKTYSSFLPQPADPASVVQTKLASLEEFYNNAATAK